MTFFKEYKKFDAVGLANLIKKKEISSHEVLETAIDLIEQNNPKINAIHQTLFDFAKSSLSKNVNSFFYGVPMLLKDMDSSLKGHYMRQGSHYLKDFKMDYNNVLTEKFISSGAIICGKSATPEFGLMITTEPKAFPSTKNPWDIKRTAGGSSGGAAASVASRMVPIAHASDGGGSIRIPAASCGAIGLKPTRGRISFSPSHGERWSGFASSGIISRSVRDTAYMYDHIFCNQVGDPYFLPHKLGSLVSSLFSKKKFKIGFSLQSNLPVEISNEAKKAVLYNAKICESLGHDVEEFKLDYDGLLLARSYVIIIACHTSAMFSELEEMKGRKFKNHEIENSSLILDYLGKKFTGHDFAVSHQIVQTIARNIMLQMDGFDSVIMPIISQKPPLLGKIIPSRAAEIRNSIIINLNLGWIFQIETLRNKILNRLIPQSLWYAPDALLQNITGQPAISVPSYWTEDGLPLGVQFVGRYGEENNLIDIASQIEEASPWMNRLPNF